MSFLPHRIFGFGIWGFEPWSLYWIDVERTADEIISMLRIPRETRRRILRLSLEGQSE